MKGSVFVFTDLDDTLLQTEHKCPMSSPVTEAAVDRQGRPLSFHSQEQRLLLQMLKSCTLIPVTGRNREALEQVRSMSFSSYRITGHGALVWNSHKSLIPDWQKKVEQEASIWEPRLQLLLKTIENHRRVEHRTHLRFRIVYDAELPVYLSIKGDHEQLSRLERAIHPIWVQEMGAVIHCNSCNMALLPPYADKARAVSYVMALIRKHEESSPLFIGMGDSATDIAFLKACHYAITPWNSQIHQEIW